MIIEKEQEGKQTGRGKRVLAIGLVLLVCVLGGLVFEAYRLVYSRPPGDALVAFIVSVLPFPAVTVGPMTISMKDYLIEYRVLKTSFESIEDQEPPAPEQLQEVILQTLINKKVITKLAHDYGVTADAERVDAYYLESILGEQTEEAFAQELQDSFGWSVQEFKKRVVESIVLALDTNTAVLNNQTVQAERRSLIEKARERIVSGETFSTVATEVMAPYGLKENDLGFFKISELPEVWRSTIDATAQSQITEVLESEDVFTLFKVAERIIAGEDTQVHLLTVTIPKKTLENLVKEYLDSVEVKRYLGT